MDISNFAANYFLVIGIVIMSAIAIAVVVGVIRYIFEC